MIRFQNCNAACNLKVVNYAACNLKIVNYAAFNHKVVDYEKCNLKMACSPIFGFFRDTFFS